MSQFLILADDYKDADALNRRMFVREDHLKRMRIEKAAGNFIIGGAKLNEQGKMHGSMLVVQLENEAAVRHWINEDPYTKGKVWEHVEILPFRVAEV
jgi:uncharacterized protein YciI